MSPEEKLLAGAELFDMACRIAMDGIRALNPGVDEAGARALLRRRLAIGRRLETVRLGDGPG